jgi:hypothetical protein
MAANWWHCPPILTTFLCKHTRFAVVTARVVPCDAARMDDLEFLRQLRDDIFEVFPPGLQRDLWLAWLEELVAVTDSMRRNDVACRVVH